MFLIDPHKETNLVALKIIILFLHRVHTHLPLDKYIHHCGL